MCRYDARNNNNSLMDIILFLNNNCDELESI